jgi:hypothetical protein
MLDLQWSDKLSELWDRIAEKDDEAAADDAFQSICHRYFSADDESVKDLLVAGAELADDIANSDESLFAVEDTYDGVVYVFKGKSETKVYNQVLRAWCDATGRKTKKKGS